MSNSCDFCRRRKLKCSRELPKCSSCIKFNKACAYTPRQRPPPLTKAYVQQLQNRIINLENTLGKLVNSNQERDVLLQNQSTADKNHNDINYQVLQGESDIQESPDSVDTETKDFKAEDFLLYEDFYNVDDLDWYEKDPTSTNDEALPIDSGMDGNTPDSIPYSSNGLIDGMGALSIGHESSFIKLHAFYGISSSNGLLRFLKVSEDNERNDNIIRKNALDSKYYSNLGLLYDQNNSKLLKSENSDILLNDPSFRNDLVNSYFDNYHCCYPFIKKTSFLKEYGFSKSNSAANPNGPSSIKDISFQVLLNTVLAIGALCKFGEPSIIDLLYYKRVKSTLQEINIMECGSYQLLNAFVLLGNYVQKRNKPNTGWNYQGLSLRMAISFGLHKEVNIIENSNNQGSHFLETRERRRRLWWGLFFFDVGLTITFGRPLHLPLLESIDIKYPLNVEDVEIETLREDSNAYTLIKPYPTIYAGLQQEARLSRISYKIYSYITKVSGINVENPKTKMSGLIELNNLIIGFAKSLPQYFKEDDMVVTKCLKEVCPQTWFKINLDGTLSIPKWFDFTRRRIIWRYKNIQILMFRSFIWESGKFFDKYDMELNDYSNLELNSLLDLCMKNCYLAAKDTINSINHYVSNCELDILSSWYATYFIFQAVLIPILLLYKKCPKGIDNDFKLWLDDIEQTRNTLISLQGFNSLAKNLIETVNFLAQPILENLNEINENTNYDNNKIVSEGENGKEGFDFSDLPSATINLFSNVGVDFSHSGIDSNILPMGDEIYDQFMSEEDISNDSQLRGELLSSEEAVINNFLQQELFPNDPIFENSQKHQQSRDSVHFDN